MIRDRMMSVTRRREDVPGIVRLELQAGPDFLDEASPGRFVQVEIPPGPFPLVRRPFTISRIGPSSFELLFEVRGRGTEALAATETGSSLRVLGPLGRGYALDGGRWLLIGGGMGAAGFPRLCQAADCGLAVLGASSACRLTDLSGVPCTSITEDGSSGRAGLVTDLLDGVPWEHFANIALCGPVAMMKAVMERVPPGLSGRVQVSAEARMGCGWGVCEGCSVPAAAGGYLKCCTDGPVIPAGRIDWERWEGV